MSISLTAEQKQFNQWFSELHAIAQNGLTFTESSFDIERFKRIQEIAAEMASQVSHLPFEKIQDLFTEESGYSTPKLDARGIVFDENKKILLVKESADNLWTLPGGFIDINESPSESVTREILEESGFITKATKLIAVYDKQKHDHPPAWPHMYKLFFQCDLIAGEATTSIETLDVKFFTKNDLPDLSLPRITKAQILRFYEHLENPNWPTDFD